MVLAPLLSQTSYESQLRATAVDILASFRVILQTVKLGAPSIEFAAFIVAVIVVSLGFSQRLSQGQAWLLLGGVASAPFAALVYFSQPTWLNDPERVILLVGVMLWVVLCCLLPALSTHRLMRVSATAVLLIGTIFGTLVGYGTLDQFRGLPTGPDHAVQSVRKNVPHDAELVVADQTGRFGDLYLLLPPLLNTALEVEHGAGADAILCTPAGVFGKTPDCSTVLAGKVATPLSDLVTTRGTFKIYELPAGLTVTSQQGLGGLGSRGRPTAPTSVQSFSRSSSMYGASVRA
jgi:hypothetical protein